MEITKRRNLSILGIAAVSMFGLAACGGGDDTAAETAPSTGTSESMMASEAPSEEASMSPSMEATEDAMMDPAANLVGPGCEGYAADVPEGDGSVAGMAQDPVATAASNNPILTQLTAAVSGGINPDVNLVDTLNGDEFTVFAPTDEAFGALPAEAVEGLKTDTEGLTNILTYHVVPGKIQPSELEGTTQTTVQGETLEVTGSGDELMVNDANVICGGVQTANAVVYLIDTVLMPPAAG
ncbi:fasciclin domain-containing protein [Arthrobacter agilis]|uniref:fasciclin domain-containing protein n=1 Tax=Arthrobacter agilis TaxID=37921 RepID=UPI000B35BD4B|nr:fasciclin domain-containing protein [Arthrobacter agilis]OUM44139.1 fasciclin [Arthrobacter agilis]PPB46515.1 fasciclin domain-containing protein [Arthrobacter agilis]TPV23829.1 fasciclin domain-containing protein [Arthrobacter agilis]WDF32268.1 fasciclin domain-containing protein [Arthrobacter agilis]VDR32564.1 Lipoprotein p23 [Arthrobacter agilis]